MSSTALESKRAQLAQEIADLAASASKHSSSAAELLGLSVGDAFIPFNPHLDQPYCVRLLTADAKRNLIVYGLAVVEGGEVHLMVADAHGSNWKTVLTDRLTVWHVGRGGGFAFNPEAVRLQSVGDSDPLAVIKFLLRTIRSKREGECISIKGWRNLTYEKPQAAPPRPRSVPESNALTGFNNLLP